MSNSLLKLRPSLAGCAGAILGAQLLISPISAQTEFTAGVVLEKMSETERYSFVSGIVEGLAFARFRADSEQPEGMACIYDWFYADDAVIDNIYQAFAHFKDHTPGAVVAAMITRSCD